MKCSSQLIGCSSLRLLVSFMFGILKLMNGTCANSRPARHCDAMLGFGAGEFVAEHVLVDASADTTFWDRLSTLPSLEP